MNRKEFMEQLEALLGDIPKEERRAALDYYEGCFEEAGKDREEEIIQRLGSPHRVADEVKDDLYGGREHEDDITYTEKGCEDARFCEERKSPEKYEDRGGKYSEQKKRFRDWWERQSNLMRVIWLGVFLAVLFSVADGLLSMVFGLAGGVLKMFGGLLGMIFGLFAGMIGVTVGAYAAGAGMIGLGVAKVFTNPALGFLYCGIGCFGIAFGIVLSILFGWLCSKVIPAVLGTIKSVLKRIFKGRRREA